MKTRRIDVAAPLLAAWTLWRRDAAVLLPIAGLFVFVPQLAVLLLVPDMPQMAGADANEAAMRAWSIAFANWFAAHGILFLGSMLLAQYATLVVTALYVDRKRPTVQGALRCAIVLLPRYLLAQFLVAMPFGAAMALAPLPGTILLLMLPILYIFSRTMLVAPALVAERPIGAAAAVARSWRLTTGNGAALMGVFAVTAVGGRLVASVAMGIAQATGGNPVAIAILACVAAAATAAAAVALGLASVVIYGRLASKGI